MRVQTVARHCDVPEVDLARANDRFQRLVRFDPKLASAEVVFAEEKHRKRVEGILSLDGEEPAVARAEEATFRAAVDTVADRLEKILRRRRSHLRDHKAPRAAEMAPPPPLPDDDTLGDDLVLQE